MKIKKKKKNCGGVWGVRGGGRAWVGGQGGCERRSKVFVKIQKKNFLRGGVGGWGWGEGSGWGSGWM